MNKQTVLDQRIALDDAMASSFDRDAARAKQAAQRAQLRADCAATSGHVFSEADPHCVFCEADRFAAQKVLARNLGTVRG
jgi:hypothetical protein